MNESLNENSAQVVDHGEECYIYFGRGITNGVIVTTNDQDQIEAVLTDFLGYTRDRDAEAEGGYFASRMYKRAE